MHQPVFLTKEKMKKVLPFLLVNCEDHVICICQTIAAKRNFQNEKLMIDFVSQDFRYQSLPSPLSPLPPPRKIYQKNRDA